MTPSLGNRIVVFVIALGAWADVAQAQGITVTRDDSAARRIEFTDDKKIAGIQAIALGDNLTQLMVSSAHSDGPASSTSMIVEHIVAACKAMNVECSKET